MNDQPANPTEQVHQGAEEGAARKRRWWRPERWEHLPHVRSGDDLTPGEHAADLMRNGMGSWAFVFAALAFLGIWMAYNRGQGFDPYPFILLNLLLSCLAAMQGAILLIAAKRADGISSDLARHDFEADCDSRRMLETLTAMNQRIEELTIEVHRHVVINSSKPKPDARADVED